MLTNAIVTAYCACKLCCGHNGHLTADGHIPKEGITIAAPRNIQFGTKVVLNNHIYIVQDRTARRFNGRYDIFMSEHKRAKQFGIHTLTIKTID